MCAKRNEDTQNIKGSLVVLPVSLLLQLESILKYYFGDGTHILIDEGKDAFVVTRRITFQCRAVECYL